MLQNSSPQGWYYAPGFLVFALPCSTLHEFSLHSKDKVNFLAWKGADGRPQSTQEADRVNVPSILAPSPPAGLELSGTAGFPRWEVTVADSIPHIPLQKSLFDKSKSQHLGTPGCLVGYMCLTKPLPRYLELPVVPVQLCSETGNNKLLANITLVIKRLHDIIPKYMRNHSQITRQAWEALKYTGFLFHALFALIVVLVSITVHCSIQKKKSSLYQESTEQGGKRWTLLDRAKMKWLLNTTVGKATFSSGRKSRLVFRSCQQPWELDQGRWDAEKGTHGLLLSCKCGVTVRRKQADLRFSAPYPARRVSAMNHSRGAHTAMWRSHLCAILGGFHYRKCLYNPLQNWQQLSQEHGGLLSHPCPHTAKGTRCVCRGRLRLHLHRYRVTHLGKGGEL